MYDVAARFVIVGALAAAWSAAVSAQLPSKAPAYVAARTTFYLCPNLIRTAAPPPAAELEKLDLEMASSQEPGVMAFKSAQDGVELLFTYDPVKKQCITNYVGPGYEQVARVSREAATRTTFRRVTGGDKDGAKAIVLESPIELDKAMIARVIIIENYTNGSSAISYSERAK